MPKITKIRPAGPDHQVVTIEGRREGKGYCTQPCPDCPWRVDAVGVFPAEAFRHSADTAYDAAMKTFACHQAGVEQSRVCAGFLLRNADNNIGVRIMQMHDRLKDDVHDGGHELHESYRAMAIANGVAPDDPVLAPCRSNHRRGR